MRHKHRVESKKLKVKSLGVATLLTFAFSLSTVSAQESVNATGGDASGSGGSASYSVGQVIYTTNSGTSGSVAEGVQQPYEISVVTGIEEAKGINLSVSAYPNPTTDFLQLKVDASTTLSIQSMTYQLYDMQGNLLQIKNLTGTETQIDMSNYVPSTYFVRVISENQSIKEFKIIKTQ
jgi:opacity protein-like surface antigen